MGATNLPGVTLDPKDEAGLETAFGVTSNAEELIKSNRARVTPELREASIKDENPDLTNSLHQLDDDGNRISLKDDVAKAVGHDVETATVRGSGARAAITYVYIGERDSLEKGVIPYDEVFSGTASAKRRAKARGEAKPSPDEAAQEAADKRIREADEEAQAKIADAQEEARRILEDAQAKAAEALAEAQQEAAETREKAAEQAPKDADKAKQAAARGSKSGGDKSS